MSRMHQRLSSGVKINDISLQRDPARRREHSRVQAEEGGI